jgi:peptidoglycan/xylan/chitin deacetylase (PgdA/CDA1 family)
VTPERFRRQLGLLESLGWTSVSLDEVEAFAAGRDGGSLPKRPYVLTFDDGYRELLEHALPALESVRAKATIYAVPGHDRDRWIDWDGLPSLELLRPDELRDLAARGVEIGSHTLTHPNLTTVDDAALDREVGGARAALRETTGREVAHFCYPFGEHDERTRAAVRRAGYRTAVTTERGRARPGADAHALPRLTVGKNMGIFRFARRVLLG